LTFGKGITAANAALNTRHDLDAVGEFFAPDYIVHLGISHSRV